MSELDVRTTLGIIDSGENRGQLGLLSITDITVIPPVIPPVTPSDEESYGAGPSRVGDVDIFKLYRERVLFDQEFDVIGRKFALFDKDYKIFGQKLFVVDNKIYMSGTKQADTELDILVKAIVQTHYIQKKYVSGIKQEEFTVVRDLISTTQLEYSQKIDIQGTKFLLVSNCPIIIGAKSMLVEEIVLGDKKIRLQQENLIKGKRDIMPILVALDLFEEE